MKYMHFNSSCAYAGLANQLLIVGHSTEDMEIVKAIGLLWYIEYDKEANTYRSGAMLQGKAWFDLYLRPLGWEYEEQLIPKEDVLSHIARGDMIGVQLRPGWKHAIIFLEKTDDLLCFLNNKYENSGESEILEFSIAAFMDMLPEQAVVGRLIKSEKAAISLENIRVSSQKT